MKTLLNLLGIVLISTFSLQAGLSTSSGGGGHHGSGGGHSSDVHVGHSHGGGGAWFYGGFGYPYWDYGYYPGYYGYYSYGPNDSVSGGGQAYSPSGPSYDDLGKFWGKNVKAGTSTHEQLVGFLRSDFLNASEASRMFFCGGFLKAYKEGAPVLDRAMDEARTAGQVKGPTNR